MFKIYCDGGSRGNPGPAASAFVVYKREDVFFKFSKYLGTNTNNFAEYSAVLFALNYLLKEKVEDEVVFYLDSELVTKQLRGEYKMKSENLKGIFSECQRLIKELPAEIKFVWTPREKNKLADTLVNEALDLAAS